MGLKKLFKPPKDIDDKGTKELLRKNGVVVRDDMNYHRKKFKFGEFGKFSEQQAQNLDTTLRPVLPNSQTGQANYDPAANQADSNQGYGYDEYASDFRGQGRSGQPNGASNSYSYSYSGGYSNPDYGNGNSYGRGGSNSYGYGYDDSTAYSSRTARNPSERATKARQNGDGTPQRRPKQNNYPSYSSSTSTSTSTNSYGYQPPVASSSGNSARNEVENSSNTGPGNGYGYEPSINNNSGSNGYGFDPYADTAVTANSVDAVTPLTKTKTSNTTVTQSTYDPYAPGEEPYADSAGAGTSASASASALQDSSGGYGAGYGSYEPDVNDYGEADDNATVTGEQVNGLASGMQELQLQKEQTQQTQQTQDQDFDPYGPSAALQTQTTTTTDLDLNAYEPTPEMQEQSVPYDEDEFEEDVDEDEEELNRIQRQTKDVREDTVNLSRTLVDNLGQANVTATNTLGVLGNQREKVYEMQNNIGTMKVQQRFVDDHVKDLEHYNRSLFHIKVNNPFTRNSRRKAKDQAFLAQRQADRANKDQLNSELYQSQRAIMDQLKNDNIKSELQEKYDYDRRVKEAAKYLTKDHDEEDERMEVEIAANVEHAQKLANNLKKKAMLMNSEIQQQNDDLHDVSGNVDYMDDKVVMTTRRIRGI